MPSVLASHAMLTYAGALAVLFLAVAPMRIAGAAPCRTALTPMLQCTEGDPTCDLDARCDGSCIIALCDTGSAKAPRRDFCAGSLAWTSLLRLGAGRSFSRASGECPVKVRTRARCRPAPEGSGCYRPGPAHVRWAHGDRTAHGIGRRGEGPMRPSPSHWSSRPPWAQTAAESSRRCVSKRDWARSSPTRCMSSVEPTRSVKRMVVMEDDRDRLTAALQQVAGVT
jgi:hypothetical protein